MTLISKLKADLLEARKAHDVDKRSSLSPLVADCETIGKDNHRAPTDDEVMAVIKSYIKKAIQVVDTIDESHVDVFTLVTNELNLYKSYLPTQLCEARIESLVTRFVKNNQSANIGLVMGYLKLHYSGQYDGSMASKVVRKVLSEVHNGHG